MSSSSPEATAKLHRDAYHHGMARECTIRDRAHARAAITGLLGEADRRAKAHPGYNAEWFREVRGRAVKELELVRSGIEPICVVHERVRTWLHTLRLFSSGPLPLFPASSPSLINDNNINQLFTDSKILSAVGVF